MEKVCFGIDVSKLLLYIAYFEGELKKRKRHINISNNEDGFGKFML